MSWVDTQTFTELNLKPNKFFFELQTFDPHWCNQKLDYERHDLLYEYLLDGNRFLYRPNNNGEIELMANISKVNPMILLNADYRVQNINKTEHLFRFSLGIYHRRKLQLLIPFLFDLTNETQRYCAAAICEQKNIYMYLIRFQNSKLYVSCAKCITWPEETRNKLRAELLKGIAKT